MPIFLKIINLLFTQPNGEPSVVILTYPIFSRAAIYFGFVGMNI